MADIKTIYLLGNRTSSIYFEDRKDAEKAQASAGTSCGLEIYECQVIPSSTRQSKINEALKLISDIHAMNGASAEIIELTNNFLANYKGE